MSPIILNYGLLIQFSILSACYFYSGDRMQGLYWLGAFGCTAGVTFK